MNKQQIFSLLMSDVDFLITYLTANNIDSLDFNMSFMGSEGAKKLAELLTKSTIVRKLYLYANELGDEGATLLAEAIKSNKTLELLYMEENGIKSPGAQALGSALTQNDTLRELVLSENRIGDEGVAGLMAGLKDNHGLKKLYMTKVGMTQIGAKSIAEMLQQNETLATLILGADNLGAAVGVQILAGLKYNSSLLEFEHKNVMFSRETYDAIHDRIQINKHNNAVNRMTLVRILKDYENDD